MKISHEDSKSDSAPVFHKTFYNTSTFKPANLFQNRRHYFIASLREILASLREILASLRETLRVFA